MERERGGRRLGRAGGENKGPLEGDVPEYGACCKGRGGGHMPIRFGTYTIQNGRNGVLELALRGMGKANTNVGVFQETKLTDGI